ncbi:MAG: hypothetical protein H7061_13710 [Bdellovibrionaceae bacterium]|nr:hypothetical protein [Bdellovibrio sp.]
MKKLIILIATVLTTAAFANETTFDSYDCKFTAAELETGIKAHVNSFFEYSNLSAKVESVVILDSRIPDGFYPGYPNSFAKDILLKITTGERLLLRTQFDTLYPDQNLNVLVLNQGIYTVYGELGGVESKVCAAKLVSENSTFFVNADTKVILHDLNASLRAFISKKNKLVVATKLIPLN